LGWQCGEKVTVAFSSNFTPHAEITSIKKLKKIVSRRGHRGHIGTCIGEPTISIKRKAKHEAGEKRDQRPACNGEQ
jgi:hypothetical protein